MADFQEIFGATESSQIISCGLLLSPEQEEAALELHAEIAHQNPKALKFALSAKKHPAYVRLYEAVLPKSDVAVARERLQRLATGMIPFHMNWAEVEQTQHFVAVWGHNNEALRFFQEAVLVEVNPLREGYFKEKYIEELADHRFTPEEEASLQKWGSPWADPYIPHMVLAKAQVGQTLKVRTIEWQYKHCLFSGLLFGTRTDTGEFTKVERFAFTPDKTAS